MPFDQKDLQGALFKNDKGDNDKRPDYRGECSISGLRYRISGWVRDSKAGQKYMSLAFQMIEPSVDKPTARPLDGARDDKGGLPF